MLARATRAEILVPSEIRRRGADACNVDPRVAVEIDCRTPRGSHAAVVERRSRPARAITIRVIHPKTARAFALTNDDLIDAVAVYVRRDDGVAIDDRRVDDLAREGA